MSMEEEQARQAAAAGASASSSIEPPASTHLSHELQRAPAAAHAAQTIVDAPMITERLDGHMRRKA